MLITCIARLRKCLCFTEQISFQVFGAAIFLGVRSVLVFGFVVFVVVPAWQHSDLNLFVLVRLIQVLGVLLAQEHNL